MDVILCEDNIEQLYSLKKIIENCKEQSGLDINIIVASTKSEDIVPIIQNKQYRPGALFILDIYLDKSNLNGFELAKIIRERDRTSSIVFSTTHAEMTYMTFLYKVEALDYVLKDEVDSYNERIVECIKSAYKKYQLSINNLPVDRKCFYFKVGPKRIRIFEDDLFYAETSENKHRIIIHTKTQVLEIYGTLNNLMEMSAKIIRCHNSFVVNKDKIKILNLNQMQVILSDGEKCYVSRKYVSKLKQELGKNESLSS